MGSQDDGTYFLTNKFGGDHSLKFGLGWRRNPIQSFSHYSGGARACSASATTRRTAARARCPGRLGHRRRPALRDRLPRRLATSNDWWTYNGYIQDSFSRGRWRLNGGLRYDWQQSSYLGGCVPASIIVPDLLPAQCEDATQTDVTSGREIQPFSNWSPRLSATYDLFGTGKTQIHASVLLQHQDHAGRTP